MTLTQNEALAIATNTCANTYNGTVELSNNLEKINYVISPTSSGFSANVYLDNTTGKYVVTFCGTNGDSGDNVSDVQILLGTVPNQLIEAIKVINDVTDNYGAIELVTGHSLGGSLAQAIGEISDYSSLNIVTLNALGTAGIQDAIVAQTSSLSGDYSNITNYVVINDFVGNMNEQVGSVSYIQPIPIKNDPLKDAHNGILDSINNNISTLYNLPNFTQKEGLALWYYDMNNNSDSNDAQAIKAYVGTKVNEADLQNAINIINSTIGTPLHSLYYSTSVGDYILDNGGDHALTGSNLNDKIWGNDGHDNIVGGLGSDEIHGGIGNDTIYGNNTTVSTGDGKNNLYGDSGNDYIIAGDGNDYLDGGADDDVLVAGMGTDILDGGSGDDKLFAGTGNVMLKGGAGNDTYNFGYTPIITDTIIDTDGVGKVIAGGTTLTGGTGVWFSTTKFADDYGFSYDLSGTTLTISKEEFSFKIENFANGNLGIQLGDIKDNSDDGTSGSTLRATKEHDTIIGTSCNDTIYGDSADVIYGEGGDDIIRYGGPNYGYSGGTIYGGSGNDNFYVYNPLSQSYNIDGGSGNDHIQVYSNFPTSTTTGTTTINNTTITTITHEYYHYYSTNPNPISTNTNTISGGIGNDFIETENNDIIYGGDGADYISAWDNCNIDGGSGNDEIHSGANSTILAGSGSDYIFAGNNSDIYGGTGTEYISTGNYSIVKTLGGNDSVTAGDYSNVNVGDGANYVQIGKFSTIYVGDGNDTVYTFSDSSVDGGIGEDYISAGGNSTLNGGVGDDNLFGGSYSTIIGGEGNDFILSTDYSTITGGDGDDTILSTDNNFIDAGAGNDNINTRVGSIVVGGAGNDTIYGEGNNTIDGGYGDDQIKVAGNNCLVNGGLGNDIIQVAADNFTVNGEDGDDLILIGVDCYKTTNYIISGGDGKDSIVGTEYISLLSDAIGGIIDGGIGDDYISNVANSTIKCGDGEDSVFGGNNNTIDGGTGNDYLSSGVNSNISGGTGNDTITAHCDNCNINGAEGDDSIQVVGSSTIDGGVGNDYISSGDNSTIVGSDGNDTIFGGIGSIIDGGDGADSIWSGTGSSIDGGADDDYIITSSGNCSISCGDGADYVYSGAGSNINGGAGNDSIYSGANCSIDGGIGDDSIYSGANNTIIGGEGADTIQGGSGSHIDGGADNDSLFGGANSTITGGDGADSIISGLGCNIDGGTGNDYIVTTGSNCNIQGGDGNDYVWSGDNNSIDGGLGNDTLRGGINSTIIGGGGADSIISGSSANIDGGVGNDTISGGAGSIINGGNDNDFITLTQGNCTVNGGTGNDVIILSPTSSNNTIDGGEGDDFYSISSLSNTNIISDSSGKDVISLSNYSRSSVSFGIDGNDLLINNNTRVKNWFSSGDNQIENFIFSDGVVSTSQINASLMPGTLIGTSGNDTIIGGTGNDTILGRAGDDVIYSGGGNDSIKGEDGNDSIYGAASSDIDGGVGNDYISVNGNNTILGGAGNDTIFGGTGSSIDGGTDNDYIVASSGYCSINGGDGADYIWSGAGSNIDGGIGNDSLYGGVNSTIIGGDGADSIQGSTGSNIDGGADNDYITASNGGCSINGGDGADYIWSGANGNIDGGLGNDSLYSGANSTISGGEGDDNIQGGTGSIIKGGVGNDYIIATGNGCTVSGEDGNDYIYAIQGNCTLSGGAGNDTITSSSTSSNNIIDGGQGDDNYSISSLTNANTISDSSGKDVIGLSNYSKSSVIFSKDENDLLLNNSMRVKNWFSSGDNQIETFVFSDGTMTATQINSLLIPSTLMGTSGDDYFFGKSGDETITGGAGNDLLCGGGGNDTYAFSSGDGNDELYDTSGTDTLKFDSSISSDDLYFLRRWDDLIVRNKTNTDEIVIDSWYYAPEYKIESMLFSDGTSVDINPTNTPISENIDEDSTLTLDVLNEYNGQLSVDSFTQGTNGTITVNQDNKLVYTPNADYNGADVFTYTLSDGNEGTITKTVNLTVNAINDAPTATLTSAILDEDNSAILDVLANASDSNGDTLSIASFTQGTNGSIVLNAQNKLVYKPNNNYSGKDSFDYTISDGNNGTVTKTVDLTINPINDLPTATLTSAILDEDNVAVLDVLANASDVDGDVLSIESFTQGANGTITLNQDNKLIYTPNANYNGADVFTYTISDGNGGTATKTVDITINAINDAPTATLTSAILNEDNVAVLDALASASDIDGDVLNISSFTQGTNGTITLNQDNKLIYTPNANYNGSDVFTYTLSDGNGGITTKTVDLKINPVNDLPAAMLTSAVLDEDTPAVLDVLANASDVDGDVLSIESFTQGANGTITLNQDNKLIYTPNANYNGADVFTYTISDGNGGTVTKTVDLAINSVNDAPTATLTSAILDEDNVAVLDVLANASDVDGDALSIESFTQGVNGSITLNQDNKLIYTPNNNFNGSDKFTYTLSDGNGGIITNTVNLTISPVNDVPTANLTSANLIEDDSVVLDVLANASDVDGDALSIESFTQGVNGAITLNEQNKLIYTPNTHYSGNDSFDYTISDGNGGTVTKTVDLIINPLPVNISGGDTDDTLTGNYKNNVINGGLGADTMSGGLGNDNYFVDNSGDIVVENAGEGIDTINSSITYTLGANVENLTLTGSTAIIGAGNSLNNTIIGNSANNTLDGNIGADTMIGGIGDDVYNIDNVGDSVYENINEGNDTVNTSIDYTLGDNIENLILTGSTAIIGTGNALNNFITGNSANNTIDGGTGADTMNGGLGNDTYYVDDLGDVVTEISTLLTETDTVSSSIDYSLGANVENLTLIGSTATVGTGNALSNKINGNTANNILNGGAGYDILDGGFGADTMIGGTGDDTYYIDSFGDVITEGTGEGSDQIFSSITYTLGANLENLTLTGTESINGTGNELNNVICGNSADTILKGGDGNDVLVGLGGNNTLDGGDGNDVLVGLGENNTLDGGAGADQMIGGVGNDTYYIDDAGDWINPMYLGGDDTMISSITYARPMLSIETLILTGTNAINGEGCSKIIGNCANNILTGSGANVVLDGREGADTMIGSSGDDTYFVDNVGDTVIEGCPWGIDIINSSATYTLGTNIENLTLLGTASINGYGNSLNNVITGNSANNTLDGSIGVDTMIGGNGDDTYFIDNVSDKIIENAGEGIDTIYSSITYTLGANVENLTLTGGSYINGTGNELNNTIIGNSSNNTLSGGAGSDLLDGGIGYDTMIGGIGDDTYYMNDYGDVVIENTGEGIDTVNSSIYYTLGTNIENLTLTGSDSIGGAGNELDNIIIGNSAYNVISGNAGNDTIDGGNGGDIMIGGIGDDTYYIDNVGDRCYENTGEGIDTVRSSITYTLGANIENLTLTGVASINGIGNELNNVITGDSANNTLDGGSGRDTMIGGAGDDIYYMNDYGDVIIENAGEGIDTVNSSSTYSLGANIENLTLTGSSSNSGTGNELNNIIIGNSASVFLIGRAGNDTYYIQNVGNHVIENSGEGIDTVNSPISYTLDPYIENLILTGSTAISGTGNQLNNVIMGNSVNNTLDGSTGIDTMIGGIGDDTYYIDNVSDTVIENVEEGVDIINSSSSYILGANVENLTLTGGSVINGTGNELDNTIIGNSASNTLTGKAGNDTYYVNNVGDTVIENTSEGIDAVISSVTYTLGANVENLTLTGSSSISGRGNELDNILIGNSANNTMDGDAGNDILDGGLGADYMLGGSGNDTYYVDNSGDTVVDSLGIDTVISSVNNYTLGGNIENLTLTGSAYKGTGNYLDNILIASDSGRNTLTGGYGNDTYYVDSLDSIVENVGQGIDTVCSTTTYTLATNFENLTLVGTSAINGTGNSYDNVISGNFANNTLKGSSGNDTYSFTSGGNNDIVNDSSGTDKIYFDSSIVKNQVAIFKQGNELVIDYGAVSGADKITTSSGASSIEKIQLSDGEYMSNTDVNNIIQAMTTYATSNGIQFTSINDVKNNQDLMAMVTSSWHN